MTAGSAVRVFDLAGYLRELQPLRVESAQSLSDPAKRGQTTKIFEQFTSKWFEEVLVAAEHGDMLAQYLLLDIPTIGIPFHRPLDSQHLKRNQRVATHNQIYGASPTIPPTWPLAHASWVGRQEMVIPSSEALLREKNCLQLVNVDLEKAAERGFLTAERSLVHYLTILRKAAEVAHVKDCVDRANTEEFAWLTIIWTQPKLIDCLETTCNRFYFPTDVIMFLRPYMLSRNKSSEANIRVEQLIAQTISWKEVGVDDGSIKIVKRTYQNEITIPFSDVHNLAAVNIRVEELHGRIEKNLQAILNEDDRLGLLLSQ